MLIHIRFRYCLSENGLYLHIVNLVDDNSIVRGIKSESEAVSIIAVDGGKKLRAETLQ